MPRPIHFEIPADNPDRAIAFYQSAFGWQFMKWEGPQPYWLITTGPKDTPGIEVVRTPAFSHTYADTHPIVRFTDVRVPAANLVGEEGDGMGFTYEWFRYERQMIAARCCGAADRLIAEATKFAKSAWLVLTCNT